MSILINIASEFTGKKAFKQAEKATFDLDKSVKKLGKSLGLALSATAVIAFGKAAAKAFAEDQRAATNLANVVDNLGLSFANPRITQFIDTLSRTAAVADDELRPAFQKLLTQTGSLEASYALLTQAIEVSRGSGVDLATVVNDLAQAYVGNLKGLRKYNLGLTQAQLKTMTFAEIQERLLKLFSGSNAKYLETYAGKMEAITVAAGEAKETIGKGLVDALLILSGNTTVQGLADDMQKLAEATAWYLKQLAKNLKPYVDAVRAIITGIRVIIDFFNTNQAGAAFGQGAAEQFNREMQNRKDLYPQAGNNAVTGYKKSAAEIKAEKEAAARAKALLKAQQANTKELKRQALTKKQSALFDLEQIQIVAALKGKITKEEELRLKLQLALITGNTDEADKLSKQLANAIDSTGNLAKFLTTLPDANNPFKNFDAYLETIYQNWRKKDWSIPPAGNVPSGSNNGFPDPSASQTEINRERGSMYGSGNAGAPNVISVQIDGKEIAKALQDQSMSAGQVAYLDRRTGGFG